MIESDAQPVALVTGGSGGLGLEIARTFLRRGYRVMIVGRDPQRLDRAVADLATATCGPIFETSGTVSESPKKVPESTPPSDIAAAVADLTVSEEVAKLIKRVNDRFGRLDALVNCVGESDRGLVENLSSQRLDELLQQNVYTALLCSQASIPMLEESAGVIVNVGSLASKVGARYIGGYAIVKHALAGMTQQMRLELKPRGIHVALLSPGPMMRSDAGSRYASRVDETLPPQAAAPGGGARLKGLDPQRVAEAVFDSATRRRPDVILPRYMRMMIVVGHAFPRLGDWLLIKFTSSK